MHIFISLYWVILLNTKKADAKLKLFVIIVFIVFIVVILKVFYIQVFEYDKLNKKASDLWSRNLPVEADRGKAIALIKDIATENDVVVIAGKGHEDYQILADKTIHFDDREEARKVFETANV